MKIFENEFAEILHDEELNILSLVYKKQVQKDDFIFINQKFLEIFRTLNIYKIYINALKIKVVPVEGQHWVINNMIPGMIEHVNGKMLYHAQVLNTDSFVKFAAQNIRNKSQNQSIEIPMKVAAFESEEEGWNWLKSQS